MERQYPIGTPGEPWGAEERAEWKAAQSVKRSYHGEVVKKLPENIPGYTLHRYGALPYNEERYPLYVLLPEHFDKSKRTVLVTGGVHGYETSGVQGAILFMREHMQRYTDHFNFVIAPCISPWGYETINRWNPVAMDPNRSFETGTMAPESAQIMALVQSLGVDLTMHIDLHETTDTDNSEFRPALAAKEGTVNENWNIPDGFYTVADSNNPQMAFQEAIIASVKQVTHIAPPDENGKIIGAKVESEGVICYDMKKLHLCGGMTDATYVTTTEVYPDSASATPEECNRAQVAAIEGGLNFILKQKE